MNTCISCKHIKEPNQYALAVSGQPPNREPFCNSEKAWTRDMVNGQAYCREERNSKNKNACGRDGRHWEAK